MAADPQEPFRSLLDARSEDERDAAWSAFLEEHSRLIPHAARRAALFSRLELAPASGESADDGRLEVRELTIHADVVFLSGCETGLGLGSVVATLWPVEDRASAELAGRFYDGLGGRDAATALAEAQRALIAMEDLSEPYFWAAYQLAGVGDAPS